MTEMFCPPLQPKSQAHPAEIYKVFCGEHAEGNPCAVVTVSEWPNDDAMLDITIALAQPVTAFIRIVRGQFYIRWFSVTGEINLCGHGSLGAGAAMLQAYSLEHLVLNSKYGKVKVARCGERYIMALPAWQASELKKEACPLPCVGHQAWFHTRDLILVLPSENAVRQYRPDFTAIAALSSAHAVIVTAQSTDNGYVFRYFAPKIGILEDSATGSAHCSLAPYWCERLSLGTLNARQLSAAGGEFQVSLLSDKQIQLAARVEKSQ